MVYRLEQHIFWTEWFDEYCAKWDTLIHMPSLVLGSFHLLVFISENINMYLVQDTHKFHYSTCYKLWETVPVISEHCVSHYYLYIDSLHLRFRVRKKVTIWTFITQYSGLVKGNFTADELLENTKKNDLLLHSPANYKVLYIIF